MSRAVQALDLSADLLTALLWQHNRADRLESLIRAKDEWANAASAGFWNDWIRDVFDLRTANHFGRRVWARILGVRLTTPTGASNPDKPTFGFGENFRNFERGNFGRVTAGSAGLPPEDERLLLRLRYLTLTTRGSIPDINRILAIVFAGRGRAYALDSNDMEWITYVFDFELGSQLRFVFDQFDALPRPATVGIRYNVVVESAGRLGFGALNQNFYNTTFAPS